jgi:transposase
MVWVCIGKNYRNIVVHEEENDEDGDTSAGQWASREDMVKKCRMKAGDINLNKRYTKQQLLNLTPEQQRQWLRVEWRWNRGKGKGVNSFDHCHRCLGPLAAAVKGTKHIVLEDNACIHTSNYSTVFKLHHKLKMLEGHPPMCCDLNPCEFVWGRMKEKVSFRGPPTLTALVKAVKDEFNAIPQCVVDKWVATYWTRLQCCVDKKGDWVGAKECRVPRTLR